MKKILFLVLAILLASFLLYKFYFEKEDELLFYGNVDIKGVNSAFYLNGKIQELLKEEGDEVEVGTLLAVLEKEPFLLELDKAQAAYDQAEANYNLYLGGYRKEDINQALLQVNSQKSQYSLALSSHARQEKLMKTRATSQKDYDDSLNRVKQEKANLDIANEKLAQLRAGYRKEEIQAAKANLALAKANLDRAKLNLEYTELYSPTKGIILTKAVELGSFVGAGATVYSISITKPVYIIAYIDEVNLPRLHGGAEVELSTDFGKKYKGKVGYISPKAEFTPKTVQTEVLRTRLVYRFRIVVEDEEADKYLRQGMPVTIRLLDDKAK